MRTTTTVLRRLTCILALVALTAAGENAADILGKSAHFSIAPQSLASALIDFFTQSGVQVATAEARISRLRSKGVKGTRPVGEALKVLLEGTGLKFGAVGVNIIAITKATQPSSEKETARSGERRIDGLQLSQVDRSTQKIDASSHAAEQDSDGAAVETPEEKGIPEILVKGKRSINTDIQRTEDDPQPYVVFSSEEIQRSQAVNVEDFLKTRLPMNTASASNSQQANSGNTTSSINLRGLGDNQTLILVDGRRMAGIARAGFPQQPDLNGIPLSAVERIEVLPSTAGGIYGGNATGGVVNVILRRDFRGIEVKATYVNTFDSDTGSLRLDASTGFSLAGGRTQVLVAASRSEANTLTLGDRDFGQRAFALTMQNNSSAVMGSPFPVLGRTANIKSNEGPLVLDPEYGGANLGYDTTHVPLGYAGPELNDGAVLVANAGSYNTDLPRGVSGRDRRLIVTPSIESAALHVRHEFVSRLQGFLDLSRLGNKGRSATASGPTSASLPADAPNNPFQQAINVTFPSPGLSFENHSEATTVRAIGGLIARLPRNWTGEVDYGWSKSGFRELAASYLVGYGADTSLNTGLPTGDGRPALNALQEGIDFTPYLLPVPNFIQGPFDTVMKDITVRLSGPAMTLPGGPVNLSILIERRDEEMRDALLRSINAATGTFDSTTLLPHRSQGADSYYLEARVPLTSRLNAAGWARELELQASIRRDEYATRSSGSSSIPLSSPDEPAPALDYTTARFESNDYTLGLRYVPLEDLALRASFGTGFLPPSVNQITVRPLTFNFPLGGVSDPKRGNTNPFVGLPWTLILGGNPDLKPEGSESWSVGLIFTPRFVSGLRLSIDYTQIDKVDEIQTPGFQYSLDNEDSTPGLVVRGENLPGDPPEWAGRVLSLKNTFINIAKTSLEAYDVQLDYTVQTQRFGDVNWYALATWQPHYENQRFATDPIVDRVGFADGLLEWRGNLGFDWTLGAWSLGWNMQYYDSYFVYNSTSSNPTMDLAVLNQGSDTIPSQMYHDLIATYRFDHAAGFAGGLLANSEISLGIQNTFNTSPPIIASQSTTDAGYSFYGDPRLRRYSMVFRKSFGSR